MKNLKTGNSVGLVTFFKKISKIIITGSLCATVGVTGVLAESNVNQNDNSCVCLSNGIYKYITWGEQIEETEFAEPLTEGYCYGKSQFDQSGKYFYFFSEYDKDSEIGTLCRVELDNLQMNAKKENNLENVEIISQNVLNESISPINVYQLISDDGVVYRNAEWELYCYNGKENIKIDDNVGQYYANEKGSIIYSKLYNRGDRDKLFAIVYEVTMNNLNDRKELTSVRYIYCADDMDNMLVGVKVADGNETLGIIDADRDLHILGEKSSEIYWENDSGYYLDETGETLNLYDYVDMEGASDTESLCESLKDESNAFPLKNLYHYQNGETNLIAENVLNYERGENCFVYNTKDMISGKVKLEDVSECEDVENLFDIDYGKENYLVRISDGKTFQVSNEGAEYWGKRREEDDSWGSFGVVGDSIYVGFKLSDEIGIASLLEGEIGSFSILPENSYICGYEGELRYMVEKNDAGTYYDLYCIKYGQNLLLAEHVTPGSMAYYGDGKLMLGRYNSDNGFELNLLGTEGEIKHIVDNVSWYLRLQRGQVLYNSEGDLYLYNGNESKLLAYDVEYVWSQNYMGEKETR